MFATLARRDYRHWPTREAVTLVQGVPAALTPVVHCDTHCVSNDRIWLDRNVNAAPATGLLFNMIWAGSLSLDRIAPAQRNPTNG